MPISKSLTRISWMGPPPLIEGEDPQAYGRMLTEVSSAVQPMDAIEEILVRDVVDLTCEILRWRRVKADLVGREIPAVLRRAFAPIIDEDQDPDLMDSLIDGWKAKNPAATKRLEKLLASANLSFEKIIDIAFVRQLERIGSIDRLTAIAESRRNAVLREIDRRRLAFALRMREKLKTIDDSEFELVKPKTIAHKQATRNAA